MQKPQITVAARLADEIMQQILDGALSPGMRLEEGGLAERFGVSRTPVRQALAELCARGIALHRPNRGVEVVRPDYQSMRERFEALAELEALCAELAAHRARIDGIAALEALVEEMECAGAEAYHDCNLRFHAEIGRMSENSQLVSLITGLQLQLQAWRRNQLRNEARREASRAEHRQLVDAIARRDAPAARDLMRRHLQASAAETLRLLRDELAPGEPEPARRITR